MKRRWGTNRGRMAAFLLGMAVAGTTATITAFAEETAATQTESATTGTTEAQAAVESTQATEKTTQAAAESTQMTEPHAAAESTFVPGTSINGLGISGMTTEEAAKHIGSFYASEYQLVIRERGGRQEKIAGTEIGYAVSLPDGFLQELLQQQNAAGRVYGPNVDNRHRVELQSTYSEEALTERINGLDFMTGNGIVETADAHVSAYEEGKPFTIVPEVWGNQVDQEKASAAVRNAAAVGMTELDLEAAGCYFSPKVFADQEELKKLCDIMNQCRDMSVTWQFADSSEMMDAKTICSWLLGTQDGQILVDREKAMAYVTMMAEKYDTSGKTRMFHTVTGRDVELTGPYGWKINRAAETDALIGVIQTGQSQTREPVYASVAVDRSEQEWGTTYAEVDLTGQHVYMVKDGAVVWDAPCVTGNLSKQYDTPAGMYSLTYKERDRVLRGEKRPDGTYEYESPVSFWMPFNGGIGFHDASWRGSFGGEIYKTGGSHGCVNLPPDKTGALYELVYKGMPVFCY
ncbi:MAG: L,D-transpeptidase family protein [Eubacteriales bacterium]|nr:L,D-transpeptidase family protein [Eubacteriales bacterium]